MTKKQQRDEYIDLTIYVSSSFGAEKWFDLQLRGLFLVAILAMVYNDVVEHYRYGIHITYTIHTILFLRFYTYESWRTI